MPSICNYVPNMFWKKRLDSRGKAVLITGCDTGFGHNLAVRLNSRGFRVYATVLDPNSMGSHELLSKCYFKDIMNIMQMDVTNQQQIDDCFTTIKNELEANGEQLWALVNNAGVITYGMLEWGSFDEYNKLFDINVFGTIRVTRKFIPLLRPSMGRIVLMASLGGRVSADLIGAYCMTKAAIISFSDTLRREMQKFRIKVITIEPAVFKTHIFYSFEESMETNWKNTNQSVRQVYGESFPETYILERHKKTGKVYGGSVCEGLDLVVNDMLKALTHANPNRVYRPINGTFNRLFVKFIDFVPQFLIDRHFNRLYDKTPEYMVEKKADKTDTN